MACGVKKVAMQFFTYSTPKKLQIQSKRVGAVYRIIQAGVLFYVLGYVCIWKKGYQVKDSVLSSVATKVKGIADTNTTDLGFRVWDVADFVIPPQEQNSFFVLTNLIVTKNQTQTHCAEIPSAASNCSSDKDCKVGIKSSRSNGRQTGKCVNFNQTVKTCEISAWCPLERGDKPPKPAVLAAAENFTVLVNNNIRFPKFSFTKRNIHPDVNYSYVNHCVFNRSTSDKDCPIFRLKDIVEEAGEDFQKMAIDGGVMAIHIEWDCNLDLAEKWCEPQYKFLRIDTDNTVLPGYNFRYGFHKNQNTNPRTRTLIKGFGIRFNILVFGKAGQFSIIPTLVHIGSGLGLLGLVKLVCDFIVLKCLRRRKQYKKQKISMVS
ncbi:P2X purinoceptor 4a-like [Alosa pseudoharengus]|uniref:P2X purinoceptor 4a-like n=1 Tax=Alosa pseudoharengus TaxID=34774 RepID=UPI003F8947E1